MVPAAIAFLVGILTAQHTMLFALSCIGIVVTSIQLGPKVAGIAFVAACCGFADACLHATASPPGDRRTVMLPAVVTEARSLDPLHSTLVVRLADGAQATLAVAEPLPEVGERMLLHAKREGFDNARNPGEPAERDVEAERGIAWRLVHARVVARAPPDGWDTSLWLPRARAWGSLRIHALLGEPDATILAGALWGERGTLPTDLRAEFQDTGTVHVLVTAGLHLGVIAALALATLSLFRCGRIASSLATVPIIWTYATLSGAHLPSVRAATMLTFALVARASGRDAYSWNALAAAAIVIAAFRPQAVESLSFALSFSCVAAIFAFARPTTELLERIGAGHVVASLFGVAIATQIGTWPLTAFGFLVFAPYAPLANAAVVPVVGIAMIAGFAAILASPIPPLAHGIANVAIALVDWIAAVVRFVAHLPNAHVIATPPPVYAIVAYDVALALLATALHTRRFRRQGCIALVFASALCLWPPHVSSHELTITAIDVGQADSLLVTTPNGHAFLVDGGGRLENGMTRSGDSRAEDVGARTVVPFLIRQGVHHLDAVILSHPHGDHAGGVPPALRVLGAGGFADSGQSYAGHAYRDSLAIATERHVPILEPRSGDLWRTDDGVAFRFYGPSLPYIAGGRNDINDNSLVFRLEYEGFRMLFTGDAGEAAERRLLASGVDLRATVLKVGHHGSAYGTTPAFARAVGASIAVISVGRHNLFGHPAPSTIATLEATGARIYRTDRDGAITISSDGRTTHATAFVVPASR